MSKLALYTTVYPGVEPFLGVWMQSVAAQSDTGFDIFIGSDGLDPATAVAAMGQKPDAVWIESLVGDSPAQVRQRALEKIVARYEGVIFVDSDDVLHPSRVAVSRTGLTACDVYGCALVFMDEQGQDLKRVMTVPDGMEVSGFMARMNIFGFSNTAWTTAMLRECMPLPKECVLTDWLFATRAWCRNARFLFDPVCRMWYRQHSRTMAQVLPPFTEEQIVSATRLVMNHYDLILTTTAFCAGDKRLQLEEARDRVQIFWAAITGAPNALSSYVAALNRLQPTTLWWACVAHPELESLWKH